MIKTVNYCNGCPECIHCGRDKDVNVLCCDDCEDIYENYYKIDNKILCRECAIEYINDNIDELVLNEYEKIEHGEANMSGRIRKILNYFGKTSQKQKTVEELAELIVAIQKNDLENIKEEISDVEIMLEQLKEIYGILENDIDRIKDYKLERTINRMKEDSVNGI